MHLVITPDGRVTCIYDETIDLAALGELNIERASYVEPDLQGRWFVDLSAVYGPAMGPFQRRSEALAEERLWLEEHWLGST